MATTTTVDAGYKGALAGEIFVEAFKKSDTIAKNAITVLPNNIGTGYLPKLEYGAELQDYSCGFNPTGTIDYTDKEVTLKKFKLDHELCKDDFAQTFQAQSSGLFSASNEIPQTIQDAILVAIVDNLGTKVDTFIWNHASLGLIAKLNADGNAIEVQSTGLTKANVIAQIEKAYDAIPEAIIESEDLVMSVSPKVARLYKQAQAALTSVGTPVGDKELDFLGVRMESIGALSGDVMFAYRVKNVGFLTGLESDLNEVRVIDHDATAGDGQIRTKAVLEMGADFSFAEEIVFYGDFA